MTIEHASLARRSKGDSPLKWLLAYEGRAAASWQLDADALSISYCLTRRTGTKIHTDRQSRFFCEVEARSMKMNIHTQEVLASGWHIYLKYYHLLPSEGSLTVKLVLVTPPNSLKLESYAFPAAWGLACRLSDSKREFQEAGTSGWSAWTGAL